MRELLAAKEELYNQGKERILEENKMKQYGLWTTVSNTAGMDLTLLISGSENIWYLSETWHPPLPFIPVLSPEGSDIAGVMVMFKADVDAA